MSISKIIGFQDLTLKQGDRIRMAIEQYYGGNVIVRFPSSTDRERPYRVSHQIIQLYAMVHGKKSKKSRKQGRQIKND